MTVPSSTIRMRLTDGLTPESTRRTGSGIHSISTTSLLHNGEDIPRGSAKCSKEGKRQDTLQATIKYLFPFEHVFLPQPWRKNRNLSMKLKILAQVVKERILINLISHVTIAKIKQNLSHNKQVQISVHDSYMNLFFIYIMPTIIMSMPQRFYFYENHMRLCM